jgi:hypothetical protein
MDSSILELILLLSFLLSGIVIITLKKDYVYINLAFGVYLGIHGIIKMLNNDVILGIMEIITVPIIFILLTPRKNKGK